MSVLRVTLGGWTFEEDCPTREQIPEVMAGLRQRHPSLFGVGAVAFFATSSEDPGERFYWPEHRPLPAPIRPGDEQAPPAASKADAL